MLPMQAKCYTDLMEALGTEGEDDDFVTIDEALGDICKENSIKVRVKNSNGT